MARPNLSYLKNLSLFLFGLPAGVLTGLTAIGSSVVLAPGVRWLLGLRPARTGATALAATGFAAFAGLLSYGLHGHVRWGLALLLTFAQVVGAGWGARLVARAPVLLRLHLLWAVLTTAAGLALAAQGRQVLHGQPWTGPLFGLSPHGFGYFCWAFVVAALVGVVSRVVELGGVLLVPAEIYLLHLPPHLAQGTALVVLLLAALPGILIYARRGDLEPQATVWLSVGGVFGALAGAFWANQIPSRTEPALRVRPRPHRHRPVHALAQKPVSPTRRERAARVARATHHSPCRA